MSNLKNYQKILLALFTLVLVGGVNYVMFKNWDGANPVRRIVAVTLDIGFATIVAALVFKKKS